MISQCPHCSKELNLTEAQKEKVKAALANLKSGTLKLGCPHCRTAIQLKPDGSALPAAPTAPASELQQPGQPAYPDISWLASGLYDEKKTVEDIPKVLVLMPEGKGRDFVVKTFEEIGYQVDLAESSVDAIAKMRFVSFAAVVLHSSMERALADSSFHAYMRYMSMEKRRYIYYILVGKEFHTLYDLEALSYSANVVINDNEIAHFDIILRKGLRDYDDLFGPYINAIKDYETK